MPDTMHRGGRENTSHLEDWEHKSNTDTDTLNIYNMIYISYCTLEHTHHKSQHARVAISSSMPIGLCSPTCRLNYEGP